jgi:hypothetical protein
VTLRGFPGYIMFVDDVASRDKVKPPNVLATALYHMQCKPGTTHKIHGDVAIAWDEDFA